MDYGDRRTHENLVSAGILLEPKQDGGGIQPEDYLPNGDSEFSLKDFGDLCTGQKQFPFRCYTRPCENKGDVDMLVFIYGVHVGHRPIDTLRGITKDAGFPIH